QAYAAQLYPQQPYPQQAYQQAYAPQPAQPYASAGYVPNGSSAQGAAYPQQPVYPQNAYQPSYPQANQAAYAPQPAPNGYAPAQPAAYAPTPANGYNGGNPNNGYAAAPAGLWQAPATGYPQTVASNDACDSAGADVAGNSAAGGGSAAISPLTCVPLPAAKKAPVRRRVSPRVARRTAPLPQPAYAQQPYPNYPPYPQQQYAPVYQQAAAPQYAQSNVVPVWNDGTAQPAAAANRPLTVAEELNQIDQQNTSTISAGVDIHNRGGEQGLSALTDIEAPIEGRLAVGDGKLVLRATPVTLDSGTPDTSYNVSSRFGSGPVAAYNQQLTNGTPIGSQSATGIGVSGAYENDNVRIDAGTTPLGFQKTNIVGGLNLRGSLNDQTTFVIDASRRAVTDSLLSYAGVKDARTGAQWGGVTSSGLRADMTWDDGLNGIYGYGSFNVLTGDGVEQNTRGEGGAGLYRRLFKDADHELTAGFNVTYFGYDKNLSYFTFGQGGYFSPQTYISLSVPVSWNARSGLLSYQVKGSLGIQHFREDDSPYFPTSGTLQAAANAAQAAAATAGLATSSSAVYPGQSKTGLGYNLQASAEYQIGPQIFFGGLAGLDNARDYSQYYGGIYLRYAFEKLTGAPAMPPVPLHSPYMPN
ncbi:MAG: cellulose synthase subunit BcsC-related outer membrane protein, partial [Janthinobacterium lividum]